MTAAMFESTGTLRIKVIEAAIGSFAVDNYSKKSKLSSAYVSVEFNVINSTTSDKVYTSSSPSVFCSLKANEGGGICLIGEEIEISKLSSNNIIRVSLVYDKSNAPSKQIELKHISHGIAGVVDIPMNRLEVGIPVGLSNV